MVKDILVAPTGLPGDAMAVEAGVALATCFQGHLAIAETLFVPRPLPSAWGMQPDEWITQELRREQREAAERRVDGWRSRLEREALPHALRIIETSRGDGGHLALLARHVDIVVVPRGDPAFGQFPYVERFFSSLLFESGRPVLVAPAESRPVLPARHAVVGWQAGREATRALHDALPLLWLAESVDVLEIGPPARRTNDNEATGVDVATHLARHGINVCVVVRHESPADVAASLLRHCEESNAGLLVAGGYGHARLREWMLGGTTRSLLRAARLPVLFSH